MPRGKVITDEKRKEIIDLIKEGHYRTTIAKKCGVSTETVYKIEIQIGYDRQSMAKNSKDSYNHIPKEILDEWDRVRLDLLEKAKKGKEKGKEGEVWKK